MNVKQLIEPTTTPSAILQSHPKPKERKPSSSGIFFRKLKFACAAFENLNVVGSNSIMLLGFTPKVTTRSYKFLSEKGWNVLPEKSAERALSYFGQTHFDLIILDIDGVDKFAPQIVEEIRQAERNADRYNSKIIGFGKFVLPHFREQLRRAGMDEVWSHTSD